MILSILIPAVPSRLADIQRLLVSLHSQIGDSKDVEFLLLLDNKRRTVGEKRDALLRAAKGKYVTYVDDDDDISPDYAASLLESAKQNPDVITFLQHSTVNGQESQIEFRLGNPNEPFTPGGITRRNAWHVCAWRRSLAVQSCFPPISYGEDWAYAAKLCAIPGLREVHIPKALHFYRHDARKTEAPPPC